MELLTFSGTEWTANIRQDPDMISVLIMLGVSITECVRNARITCENYWTYMNMQCSKIPTY